MGEQLNYMGYEWISIEDGVVTVGITEEAVADLSDEIELNLPEQDDVISAGKVCGDIESDNGSLNLYSPVSGTVIEVNEAVLENQDLLQEDPTDEGWLFKVEADDPDKLDQLSVRATNHDDDDDDDNDDDDDFDDDEPLSDGDDEE
ncbi:MAG: glycine cleavage system protein H [Bdellovibrionales bacterium]|nr:glycine cleavage system protein H [Bdellovibrionales bacterium]